MSETNAVAEWLYTTLKAGTALCAYIGGTANPRIFEDFCPGTVTTRPCVIFQMVDAADVMAVGGNRATTDQEWFVYAVSAAETYNAVAPIADAIDTLLHDKQGTATVNGATLVCTRSESMRYTTIEEGKVWKYMGGYYHIFAGST